MAICPNCGVQGTPEARVCTQCGTRFAQAPAKLAKTMIGMRSPLADPAPQEAHGHSPRQAASAETRPSPQPALGATMIGMPSPVGSPVASESGRDSKADSGGAPRKKDFNQTMLGVGSPAPLESPLQQQSTSAVQTPPAAEAKHPPGPQPAEGKFKGTLLGIAQPGLSLIHI